jgi:DNA sulfur modification protein DndB
MSSATYLPSIRAFVGDWSYYVTTLTFSEVAELVAAPDEIHERKKLAEWIQREAIETHAAAISSYIAESPQRFLGSLIVGVYGGSPDWIPVNVRIPDDQTSTDRTERVEGRMGILQLSGSERLFAIDGQHRVAGIKLSLKNRPDDLPLRTESVSAIFVAHDPLTEAGKQRTRRLFTTVNKKAKVISKAAKIALDEDDGFAIVTRRLIDLHPLFEDARKHVLYSSGGSIPQGDVNSITSVVGLSEIVKDLYGGKKSFDQGRPNDEDLAAHLQTCVNFFDEVLAQSHEFDEVFVKMKASAGHFREPANNHMLFRPVGQRTFARAVQLLLSRGDTTKSAVGKLCAANLYLNKPEWHHILWDPISQTMITGTLIVAEALLLRMVGEDLRNKSSGQKLDKLLASRKA